MNTEITESGSVDYEDYEDELAVYYYPSDLILENLGQEHVSSRSIGSFFLPSKRIPKRYFEQLRAQTDRELEKLLTGETPLLWKDFPVNPKLGRPFDTMRLELYGAIALSDDRAVLDAIIGMTGQFVAESSLGVGMTIDDVTYSLGMDVDFEATMIDRNQPLSDQVAWHRMEANKLLAHLGMENKTSNKKTLKTRLERISKMQFFQRFYKNDVELPNAKQFQIIANNSLFFICDNKKIKNASKKSINTYTDVFVGISSGYKNELPDDSFLSRERLHRVYPRLHKTKVMDFLKFIDSNLRDFIHTKYLTWAIDRYFSSHPAQATSQNQSHIRMEMFNNVVAEADLLLEHFNLILKRTKISDLPKRYKGLDYQFIYNKAKDLDDKS